MLSLSTLASATYTELGAMKKLRQSQLDGFKTFSLISGNTNGIQAKAPLSADVFQRSTSSR